MKNQILQHINRFFLKSITDTLKYNAELLYIQTRILFLQDHLHHVRKTSKAYFNNAQTSAHNDDSMKKCSTTSRMTNMLLFTGIYANVSASVWFRIGCTRIATDDSSMGECMRDVDSWVTLDPVLDMTSTLSAYLRSMHFVTQTLFTVGFGDIHPVSHSEFAFAL
jgi:hypothetical protein